MATVFVWENHFIKRPWKAFDPTWTGHSSLCITDNFVDTRALVANDDDPHNIKMEVDGSSAALVNGTDDFVSFWPGAFDSRGPKDVNNFNDGWKMGVTFMAMSKPSIFADVALETYAPDHVVRITTLDVLKMTAKWRHIRSKDGAHYKFLRKNCSTIVAHVMQAGSPWYNNDHYMIWTPTNVRDYALKLGTSMLWSDFIDELENKLFGTKEQLALLRKAKRRSGSRGTSGGLYVHP
jgi:hypothetical protein